MAHRPSLTWCGPECVWGVGAACSRGAGGMGLGAISKFRAGSPVLRLCRVGVIGFSIPRRTGGELLFLGGRCSPAYRCAICRLHALRSQSDWQGSGPPPRSRDGKERPEIAPLCEAALEDPSRPQASARMSRTSPRATFCSTWSMVHWSGRLSDRHLRMDVPCRNRPPLK